VHAGVQFRNVGDPVLYLSNPQGVDNTLQRNTLESISRLNRMHLDAVGDPEIATRINSYEMAYRMQLKAPEVVDIAQEPQHVLDMYGAKPGQASFANSVLLARRLVENGVRFVQIFHEAWDQHGDLVNGLKTNCRDTDQACAALVKDLKARGMLEDTLVVWGGEFGRTPMSEKGNGRDHNPWGFTMWFAGGGVKPGVTVGTTDDLGLYAIEDRSHVHDIHATILHLLGLDHERLTYLHNGLPERATMNEGRVIGKLLG
jgi:uncharacterized protein (DUF1501 family)